MATLAVFDPPMCCSTGICGPVVDPVLPRIAADLEWLRSQGIVVERYNLGHQPQAFASNPIVTSALKEFGNEALPLLVVDGQVALRGRYPDRDELSRLVGLKASEKTYAEGASCALPGGGLAVVGGGCEPGGSDGSSCC